MAFLRTGVLLLALGDPALGFSSTIFQDATSAHHTFQSKNRGIEIELPDFDELYGRIQDVSPLARIAIMGGGLDMSRGFDACEKLSKS